MKKMFLSLLLVALALPMVAQNRSDNEMAAIAAQKIYGAQAKGLKGNAANLMKRVYTDQAVAVYSPEDEQQFVIVGRDERMRPVLGYAAGRFDINKIPCGMRAWLDGINRSLEALDKAPESAQTSLTSAVEFQPVAPMLTTKWQQGEPFNRLLPMVTSVITGETEHAQAGCVATGMAQIMNYWKWPASATFKGYYYVNEFPTPYSLDINSQYTWPLQDGYGWYLPDGYNDPPTWDDGIDAEYDEDAVTAISTLIRDCGYAVEMEYDGTGGAATLDKAAVALRDIFSYSPATIQYLIKDLYTPDEWLSIIYSELQAGRPVLYGACDSETFAGHAFVLHGIDAEGLLYINWGWKGWYDGSYAMDAFNVPVGLFNALTYMVTGITLQPLPIDEYHSLMTTTNCTFTYTPDSDPVIKVTLDEFISYSFQPFTGRFYMVVQDLEGGEPAYLDIYRQPEDVTLVIGAGYQQYPDYPEAVNFEPGHSYRLYVASRAANEANYQPVRMYGELTGPICYTLTIDAEGNGEITGPELMEEFLLTGVKKVKDSEIADDGITRVYDMQGRLVHSAPTASFNLWAVPARGVLIIKQGDSVRKVAR